MLLLSDFFKAALFPTKRLSVIPFLVLFFCDVFARAFVHAQAFTEGDTLGELWLVLSVVLIWIGFCAVANRFHDAGMSAMWVGLFFLIHGVIYIGDLDPTLLAADELGQQEFMLVSYAGQRIVGLLTCALLFLCIRSQSETGSNLYGPPFGEVERAVGGGSSTSAAPDTKVKLRQTNAPSSSLDASATATSRTMTSEHALGERPREFASSRPSKFGRRAREA